MDVERAMRQVRWPCAYLGSIGVALVLLWPTDWTVRAESEKIVVLDGMGQAVARMGDEVHLRGWAVPHDIDVAVYRQLIDELPGDCIGVSWLVDGVE